MVLDRAHGAQVQPGDVGRALERSISFADAGALPSVSVWANGFGVSLGPVACAQKSNEITAIPELLRLVDIKGAIVTIDAMGTQKAIAAQIIESNADDVVVLKGNHETLHQAVIEHIDEQLDEDLANAREHVTTEKGHGREDMRTYLQLPAPRIWITCYSLRPELAGRQESNPGFGLISGHPRCERCGLPTRTRVGFRPR